MKRSKKVWWICSLINDRSYLLPCRLSDILSKINLAQKVFFGTLQEALRKEKELSRGEV